MAKGKKLPRRTMSIAKRVGKVAEEAADLDLLGGDAASNKPAVPMSAQVGAFILVIVALIATIMIVRLVMAIPTGGISGDAPFGVEGALYRVTPTVTPYSGDASASLASASLASASRSTLASVPRSPFPEAQQAEPIIMAVDCPVGTVGVATGDRVADTVCIVGVLITHTSTVATPTVTPTPTASAHATPSPTARTPLALPDAGGH